jgi:hypothetical protein
MWRVCLHGPGAHVDRIGMPCIHWRILSKNNWTSHAATVESVQAAILNEIDISPTLHMERHCDRVDSMGVPAIASPPTNGASPSPRRKRHRDASSRAAGCSMTLGPTIRICNTIVTVEGTFLPFHAPSASRRFV